MAAQAVEFGLCSECKASANDRSRYAADMLEPWPRLRGSEFYGLCEGPGHQNTGETGGSAEPHT